MTSNVTRSRARLGETNRCAPAAPATESTARAEVAVEEHRASIPPSQEVAIEAGGELDGHPCWASAPVDDRGRLEAVVERDGETDLSPFEVNDAPIHLRSRGPSTSSASQSPIASAGEGRNRRSAEARSTDPAEPTFASQRRGRREHRRWHVCSTVETVLPGRSTSHSPNVASPPCRRWTPRTADASIPGPHPH